MKHYSILKFTLINPKCRLLLIGIASSIFSAKLSAHGFGERYDLPVPLALYLGAAGLAIIFSFVVIAFFIRGKRPVQDYPRLNIITGTGSGYWVAFWMIQLLKIFSVGMLILIVVSGFYGKQNPFENIAPTAVWVIWWVGFSYIAGLLGNLWAAINPWSSVFFWLEKLCLTIFPKKQFGLQLDWPQKLESWPAVVLFSWFVWAELIWPRSDSPIHLAQMVFIYSGITWLGMWLFGRHQWLQNAEVFSILFSYLGRFAPTEFRVKNISEEKTNDCVNNLECFERAPFKQRRWGLRPFAVGLLTNKPLSMSACVFVLFMLASVTFDGLMATPLWAGLAKSMIYSESLRPFIIALQDVTGNALAAVASIALVLFFLLFTLVYLIFSSLMWIVLPAAQRDNNSIILIARTFVLTLIPIALAYHLAHYLSYLAIVGQYIIPLASDPLGLGWNLFGTSLYLVDISVINAKLVWHISVIAIVIGHVFAVWLGHVMALRQFGNHRVVLKSQVPLLFLMVGYTILSLWIMAQPVVEF